MQQNDTALLIIDVQLGMFEESNPVYQGDKLLATISNLIARVRAAGLPVIYVQHSGAEGDLLAPGSAGWPIYPAIAPSGEDLVIHKHHPDSFQDTKLQCELDAEGIKHLIVVGIQTEYCVDTTCRRAYSLGYDVILVQDAHSTWDSEHLKAPQIIAHHNEVLGGWFATLKTANGISTHHHPPSTSMAWPVR